MIISTKGINDPGAAANSQRSGFRHNGIYYFFYCVKATEYKLYKKQGATLELLSSDTPEMIFSEPTRGQSTFDVCYDSESGTVAIAASAVSTYGFNGYRFVKGTIGSDGTIAWGADYLVYLSSLSASYMHLTLTPSKKYVMAYMTGTVGSANFTIRLQISTNNNPGSGDWSSAYGDISGFGTNDWNRLNVCGCGTSGDTYVLFYQDYTTKNIYWKYYNNTTIVSSGDTGLYAGNMGSWATGSSRLSSLMADATGNIHAAIITDTSYKLYEIVFDCLTGAVSSVEILTLTSSDNTPSFIIDLYGNKYIVYSSSGYIKFYMFVNGVWEDRTAEMGTDYTGASFGARTTINYCNTPIKISNYPLFIIWQSTYSIYSSEINKLIRPVLSPPSQSIAVCGSSEKLFFIGKKASDEFGYENIILSNIEGNRNENGNKRYVDILINS